MSLCLFVWFCCYNFNWNMVCKRLLLLHENRSFISFVETISAAFFYFIWTILADRRSIVISVGNSSIFFFFNTTMYSRCRFALKLNGNEMLTFSLYVYEIRLCYLAINISTKWEQHYLTCNFSNGLCSKNVALYPQTTVITQIGSTI